ncbi:hypothetical protein D3C78_1514190 [compost metagenome]
MIVINQFATLGLGRQPWDQIPHDNDVGVCSLDFSLQQVFAQKLWATQRERIEQPVGKGDLLVRHLLADLFANFAADANHLVTAVVGIIDILQEQALNPAHLA